MSKTNLRIKVGLTILSIPNTWISVSEIAYLSGATVRQMQSALAYIPGLDIKYTRDNGYRQMYLTADDDEQRRIFTHLMSWRYKNPHVMEHVVSNIPYEGWITCKDLSAKTGVHQVDLKRMLDGSPHIVASSDSETGKLYMYHRVGEKAHV